MTRKGRGNIPIGKVQRAFYLTAELADALRIEAAKRNESQSAIVERALRKELNMMALTWRVVEDNGGGLHLAVFDGGRCIYYRYGYENAEDGLRSDLAALRNGVDPRDDGWDMPDDVDDPQAWYDALRVGQTNGGVIVADELGIYPDRMGRAAQRAFGFDAGEPTMTPGEAWEGFVGDQGVIEFLVISRDKGHHTPEAAVAAYLDESYDDLIRDIENPISRGKLEELLLRYIEANVPSIDIDDLRTTYSDGFGRDHEAILLPWHVVEDILGHEHTGDAEEDALLIETLRAAGAPDWVRPGVAGWVDEHGWGIYAPAE